MTKYEILAIIISGLAFLFSIPGGILSILDIRARKVRLSVSFERRYCIPTECNGTYKLNIRYNFVNKSSVPFTIRKVEAAYDGKQLEVFRERGIFQNVPFDANACQEIPLSFEYDKPIENGFELRIYTNSNVITQKLSLPSDLKYHKENRWR